MHTTAKGAIIYLGMQSIIGTSRNFLKTVISLKNRTRGTFAKEKGL